MVAICDNVLLCVDINIISSFGIWQSCTNTIINWVLDLCTSMDRDDAVEEEEMEDDDNISRRVWAICFDCVNLTKLINGPLIIITISSSMCVPFYFMGRGVDCCVLVGTGLLWLENLMQVFNCSKDLRKTVLGNVLILRRLLLIYFARRETLGRPGTRENETKSSIFFYL